VASALLSGKRSLAGAFRRLFAENAQVATSTPEAALQACMMFRVFRRRNRLPS